MATFNNNFVVHNGLNVNSTATILGGTNATNNTTGALIVTGGAGISQSLYANALYDSNLRVVTSVTANSGTDITITAVTSNGPAVSFTVNNTATLQSITGRGATTTNAINITNLTGSGSTNTGALTVSGGVGIGQDLYVGGVIHGTVSGTFTGVATTATNLQGGSAGQVPYQVSPGVTAFTGTSSVGYVFVSNGTGAPQFQNLISINTGTFNYLNVNNTAQINGNLVVTGNVQFSGVSTVVNSNTVDIGNKLIYLSTLSTTAIQAVGSGISVGQDPTYGGTSTWISFTFDGNSNWASTGGIYPSANSTYNLGTNSANWATIYSTNVRSGWGYINTLTVTNPSTFGAISATVSTVTQLTVTGNETVGGTLAVTGLVYANGGLTAGVTTATALTVTGASTLNTVSANTTTITGALSVSGLSSLGPVTASTATITQVNATTLSVTGLSTLGALTATNSTLTQLTVSGQSTLNSVSATTLTVTGLSALGRVTASTATFTQVVVTGNVNAGSVTGQNLTNPYGLVYVDASNTLQSSTATWTTSTGVINGTITLANTATNLSGGSVGSIPYNTNIGKTTQLPIGIEGQLMAVVAGLPQWATPNNITVNTATNFSGGGPGAIPFQLASGNTAYDDLYFRYEYSGSTSSLLTVQNIIVKSGSSATSQVTGALQVIGGAGITGSIYAGNIFSNGNQVLVGNGTGTNYVSSVSAGTDISVTTITGAVVVSDISTLQSVTGRGNTTTNSISITNATSATSTTTGALTVVGGLGVGGAIYGGNIYSNGAQVLTSAGGGGYVSSVSAGTDTAVTTSTGAVVVYGTSTLQSTTNRGATTTNKIQFLNTASSTATAILNSVDIQGGLWVNKDLTVQGVINAYTATVTQIYGNSGQFFGDLTGSGALYAGIASGFTPLPGTVLQLTGNIADYIQTNFQNIGDGATASADWVATANNGSNYTGFIDMGIANGSWDGSQQGSIGWAAGANDGYLYVAGDTGVGNGNLVLGSISTGSQVKISVGVPSTGSWVAVFNPAGTVSTSTTTGAVIIKGGMGISGGIYAGGAITATSITVGSIVDLNTLLVQSTTASTSTTTGALIVSGGVGVGKSLYASALYDSGARVLTTATVGSYGVTSITAGTDTAITTSTGNVTIYNTSTLQSVTNRGATTNNAISITNTSSSTSTTTGALTVTGGVGIGGNLNVGGNTSFTGNVTFNGTATYVYSVNSYYTQNYLVLNAPPQGQQMTFDNGKDVGIIGDWYNTAASTATAYFLGWRHGTASLEFFYDGYLDGSGRWQGDYGDFTGRNLISVGNTNSTSTTTGAITTVGGIGAGGNITAGGTVQHSGLIMTSGTNIDQIYTTSTTLTLNTNWQNTSVYDGNLPTGSYMVQCIANDSAQGGGEVNTYYTGVMSWYSAVDSENSYDEITLHRAGAASGAGAIFLQVQRTNGGYMALQIAGDTTNTSPSTYTFSFRRMI